MRGDLVDLDRLCAVIATGLGRGPLGCCDGYRSRLSTILVDLVATGNH